ncbi:MAG: LamG-like jellyroll fold domain-containing protein [Thermoguttaceae bacterium]
MGNRGSRGLLPAAGAALVLAAAALAAAAGEEAVERFEGRFYSGEGDVEYLGLLDASRRMFSPDPELQNMAMLYTPAWNGLVEGPTWGAWWIQNSYGPTYCGLPLLEEPLITFLQNAQDLWFDQMGDGKRTWTHQGKELVIPDGQLCDAASPGWYMPKQGDGNVAIHDWGVEFTAAGLLMQAELLLIGRDQEAIARYLPRLRRCADFLQSRRDPKNNLLLAGPAGNLLAPSYAGWQKGDGTWGQACLAGLSITYIAALDRLIELEKLAGDVESAKLHASRRELTRQRLPLLVTDEGYFVKYVDPDGTRHGVYGAEKYAYFEAVANHDAVCFRVADDAQAEKIYQAIASIPGLRPHALIITNYPGLDDMYTPPTSWLWQFGTWVNGGHWSTCEARMVMAYYRLGKYEDARRSMQQMMRFAREFRMDNPLVDFGAAVYQPKEPINLCYDSFGPAAAMIRGLFEYLYRADDLVLLPHVPPGITRLRQNFPIRFGTRRLYLSTVGSGPVTTVQINGRPWPLFDEKSITLPYSKTPQEAVIHIGLGAASPDPSATSTMAAQPSLPQTPPLTQLGWSREQFPVISTNSLPLRIGGDSLGGNRFLGRMAAARVFNRALAADQIARLARNDSSTLAGEPSLVGDWRLAEAGEGTVANQAAEKNLSARTVGQCRVVDDQARPAMEFSGEGFLEVTHDDAVNLAGGCTLEAWICPQQQAAGGGRIIDKSEVGTSNGYLLDTYPGNSLRLITECGTLSYDAKLEPGRWVHVAATADADGALALYVDGRQVSSKKAEAVPGLAELDARIARVRRFHERLVSAGLGETYEAAHARLAVEVVAATCCRLQMLAAGTLKPLPAPSQYAADKSYLATAGRLCEGLQQTLATYEASNDEPKMTIWRMWVESQ